jgi:predicted aminopeptidase
MMRVVVAFVVTVMASGCVGPRYLTQAAQGQLEILQRARPITEVINDPDTPERTVVLLQEVERVVAFAEANGLKRKGTYKKYVELDRPVAVWFVGASKPLAFEPKIFSFPIVGSFPGLGWFDFGEALRFRDKLADEGWDVWLRGAGAYSTGGWFPDPIYSSMLSDYEDAFRYLINVTIHEMVHVNVLVNDQASFNESVASFVGDRMAEQYIEQRFGPDSEQLAAYRQELVDDAARAELMSRAYQALDSVYQSDATDAEKRKQKQQILAELETNVRFARPPNNAALIGYKTYHVGHDEFEALWQACEQDWHRFLYSVRSLGKKSFSEPRQEDLKPVLMPIVEAGCPAET